MKQKGLTELTDQELLDEAKKVKSSAITHALFIGLLIGIVFYSVVKNTVGFFTLIPLFMAYKLINNSNNAKNKALENLLKERNLKESMPKNRQVQNLTKADNFKSRIV
jgi:hypothetical protein